MVLGLLFALTAIGCSFTRHAVFAEGFTRPEWRPIDAFPPAAEDLGREALETIGYDGLLRIARRVDWITTQPRASLPPDLRAGLAEDGTSPDIDVFTKEAYKAGVTTLVDAPVPSRTNVHGLGILVLGLFHAHYLALQELDGPGGKLLCAVGHPDLRALPCLYLPPEPLPLPATTAAPVPAPVPTPTVTTPPSAVSVPKPCGTTYPTSKGPASAGGDGRAIEPTGDGLRRRTSADPSARAERRTWVGYPKDNPARSNDPSGPCPQPFVPAPASGVKKPDPPPPGGKTYAENKAILKARQDAGGAPGAARQAVGATREAVVAKHTGGQVSGARIKAPSLGSTDIDVVAGNGDLVMVGGPKKAADLGNLGRVIKLYQGEAAARGVGVQAHFAANTPQKVIDFVAKRIGAHNVFKIQE